MGSYRSLRFGALSPLDPCASGSLTWRPEALPVKMAIN
jgi:hypothetical protein